MREAAPYIDANSLLLTQLGDSVVTTTASIGVVAAFEFESAQAAISELSAYCDYEDWLDLRFGLQFALMLAGVNVRIVVIDLSSFLEWCCLSEKAACERAIDAFASSRPEPPSAQP